MSRSMSFVIAEEEYAIPLTRVHELAPEAGITPLPSTPPFVLGLLSLHGIAVPVLDLQLRFRGTAARSDSRRSVLVLQLPIRGVRRLVGIAIDALGRVLQIDEGRLQPPPDLDTVISLEFLAGVVEREGRFVFCLDVDRLLRADEADAVAQLAEEAAVRPAAPAPQARHAYLCARVAGERCAVPLASLDEIASCGTIARIPGAASYVLGAANVRGTIVPVVDVGQRFGLRGTTPAGGDASLLLATPDGRQQIAARVEAVEGLFHVLASEVNATPPFGARFPGEVVEAMVPLDGAFVPVLDVARVLAEDAGSGGTARDTSLSPQGVRRR